MTTERIPPHSIEAEQSLIGALLLDNEAWDRVADIIGPRDFYKGAHRIIYEQIEMLIAGAQPADTMTVSLALDERKALEQIGGMAYLGAMAQSCPSAKNIRRYAELVRDKAMQRNLARAGMEIAEAALAHDADVDRLMDDAERKIFELHQRRIIKQPVTFKQILQKVFESVDHRYHSDRREITGIPMGFSKLDLMTAGMQPGDLIVVAGRPSMGKTALAMNIAEHVGLVEKKTVAVFSIEMTDMALVQRMLGSVGRVDQHKLRTGMLHDHDWGRLCEAMSQLQEAPFLIEETAALTISELRARARRIAKDNANLGLLIIDYLQLMATHGQSQSERTAEIGEISRGLKALAKELNIPVMALSQLNRGVEARINKRPMNSDLRDSGSIEQDADVIIHMYRDEYYDSDSPAAGYAEAIIGKQRNGDTGTVYLRFIKQETRFEDCDWTPPKKEKRKKKGFEAEPEPRQRADIDG